LGTALDVFHYLKQYNEYTGAQSSKNSYPIKRSMAQENTNLNTLSGVFFDICGEK
jgi:hypothetical protein